MIEQSLNGVWNYRVGKGKFYGKQVPFSSLPVGKSECVRKFDLNSYSEKVFLRFDRITYHGKVTLNGEVVGEMLPYSEYTFDITNTVKPKDNLLCVELEDINVPFGPTAGWENFGGIIGNVSVLYSSKSRIEDVFFHCCLENNYKDARYVVEISVQEYESCSLKVQLYKDESLVDEYRANNKEDKARLLKNVELWSPDNPQLYSLKVTLSKGGKIIDEYSCFVGFREFTCDRHRFYLNGQPIFLQGVCRHEMFGEYGHTVPVEKVEEELKRIKSTGCNFVRLVHYPHAKSTLDIADKLGLMVSEEPGLWWSDTSNEQVSKGSLEVLQRTIMRDRNHPSIVFWLCFNECRFTEQFLIDAVQTCRQNDSTRLVSGANCMNLEDTKKFYSRCGFDFYTMHPYAPTFDLAMRSAEYLADKPLLFTEWGGFFVYDNPHLLSDFIHEMYALYLKNSDEGALAGACIWYWREVNDFNRGKPACVDGMLKEGLLDSYGNPTLIYDAFCKAWKDAKNPQINESLYEFNLLDSVQGKTALIGKSKSDFSQFASTAYQVDQFTFYERRRTQITVGPKLAREEINGIYCTPFVIGNDNEIVFEGSVNSQTLTILGMVSAPKGYPISGEYGESGAVVKIEFADGETQTIELQNGVHFTTVFTTLGSSRIVPIAEKVTPFAHFSYEKNFEKYLINRLDIDLKTTRCVRKVTFKSTNNGYSLLIYGVFA